MKCNVTLGYVMPVSSSMAPLHFLSQDDQNEEHYDPFYPLMPLGLAFVSRDSDGVFNGIIAFIRSR